VQHTMQSSTRDAGIFFQSGLEVRDGKVHPVNGGTGRLCDVKQPGVRGRKVYGDRDV